MNRLVDELEYKLIQYQEDERREREANHLYNQRTSASVKFSDDSLCSRLLKQIKEWKKPKSKKYKTPRKNKLSKD